MERRIFIRNSVLAAGLVAIPRKGLLLANKAEDPWKMRMLRNNVGIFTEKGGTIGYILSKNGIVVIDAEFPEQAQHLIDELKKQSDKPFKMLINTHHHGDHTSGNIAFKGLVGSVAAHKNSLINQQKVAAAQKTEDKQLYPDTTFDDTQTYSVADESIRTHYYGPAHTNGDAIIHLQHANIAHMGDLVFNRRYAFVDRSAGASIRNWITVLDKALGTFDKDTMFIFGHSFDPQKVTGDKEDLKAMRGYLTNLYDFVEREIKAGKSKDDIIKAKTIPGVTEWQGDGIERGLQAAYEEISA